MSCSTFREEKDEIFDITSTNDILIFDPTQLRKDKGSENIWLYEHAEGSSEGDEIHITLYEYTSGEPEIPNPDMRETLEEIDRSVVDNGHTFTTLPPFEQPQPPQQQATQSVRRNPQMESKKVKMEKSPQQGRKGKRRPLYKTVPYINPNVPDLFKKAINSNFYQPVVILHKQSKYELEAAGNYQHVFKNGSIKKPQPVTKPKKKSEQGSAGASEKTNSNESRKAPAMDSVEDITNSEDDPEKLWCYCRKPYNGRFMICCDRCQEWFHGTCVGLTRAQGRRFETEKLEWLCYNCKTNPPGKLTADQEFHSS